ncbi:MAG: endonuclease/exonuclease/phosphatase family protein [Cyclobacteriaceae bacterium]
MRLLVFLVLGIVFQTNLYAQGEIKIITYNILEGLGNTASYGEGRRDRCIEWLKGQKADVVALQEWYGSEAMLAKDAKKWGHDHYVKSGPIALTSNNPIVLKKIYSNKGFWNTVLQAEVHGIDFFAIHLSPADWKFRLGEANLIKDIIDSVKQHTNRYMLLGDFNAHSPFDAKVHDQNPELLAKYAKGDRRNESEGKAYRNLMDYHYDYSVMSRFLSFPLVDVTQRMVPLHNRHTFPTPILIDVWRTAGNIGRTPERIDYILTSMELSPYCKGITVHNGEPNDYISDHYPVEAIFELPIEDTK